MTHEANRAGLVETSTLWAVVSLAAFSLPGLSGCAPTPEAPVRDPEVVRLETEVARLREVRDVGNGIFVFPAGKMFPETLSDFRGKHPELAIVSVTQGRDVRHGYGDCSWGAADDFIVVTEKR